MVVKKFLFVVTLTPPHPSSNSVVQAYLCHSPLFVCRFVITCPEQQSSPRGGDSIPRNLFHLGHRVSF
jgi:hypothetical protein